MNDKKQSGRYGRKKNPMTKEKIPELFTRTTERRNSNVVSLTDEEKEGLHLRPPMSKHGVLTAKR